MLHYVGYDRDAGGIVAVVRALAAAGADDMAAVLGVNRGFIQQRSPALPVQEFDPLEGERIGPGPWWRARRVAHAVAAWLAADPRRRFHGHSRAGLLVAWWLVRGGERRVTVSVHCYGRQRWFYRRMAAQLGGRLYWLSPAMKRHYGVDTPGEPWAGCVPPCVPAAAETGPVRPGRRGAADGVLRLGGVGALARWKRWELVPAALARLAPDLRARVSFAHIGGPVAADGPAYGAELRATTARLGLDGQVAWRGEKADSAGLLAESDVLVVAAQNEPFSVAMLEALRAGVPVLAARSGGAVDLIEPGRSGWFFRDGDAGDLAARIAALLRPESWSGIAVGPETVRRCAAPAVAAQWREIYARQAEGS